MRDLPTPGSRVDLICRSGYDAIKASFLDDGTNTIVRTGISPVLPVTGEVFTVEVAKSWVFGNTPYLSGTVTDVRLDVDALGLTPLKLTELGPFPLQTHDLEELPGDVVAELERSMPLTAFELEWVMPGFDPRSFEESPIVKAAELRAVDRGDEAEDLLLDLLAEDLRCLDAHAHLGNLHFDSSFGFFQKNAERHYRVGVAIGDLSLPRDKPILLPYPMVDNRPYLRCLHGLGLCRWRSGDLEEAEKIFRRGLLLSPHDNLGLRFLLEDLKHGRSWENASG